MMKRPQLSLRDLFGFILVAAILCGWLTRELQWRKYATKNAAAQKVKLDTVQRDVDALAQKLRAATAVPPAP